MQFSTLIRSLLPKGSHCLSDSYLYFFVYCWNCDIAHLLTRIPFSINADIFVPNTVASAESNKDFLEKEKGAHYRGRAKIDL